MTASIEIIQNLLGECPVFGICLGMQLLALALGGSVTRITSGGRGGTLPVKNLMTGKVEMTSQHSGFAVNFDNPEQAGWEVTHVSLNEKSIEGIRSKTYNAFGVQYHPEASPGPRDADFLFTQFTNAMNHAKA